MSKAKFEYLSTLSKISFKKLFSRTLLASKNCTMRQNRYRRCDEESKRYYTHIEPLFTDNVELIIKDKNNCKFEQAQLKMVLLLNATASCLFSHTKRKGADIGSDQYKDKVSTTMQAW